MGQYPSACASIIKTSDQPAHTHSLSRVFDGNSFVIVTVTTCIPCIGLYDGNSGAIGFFENMTSDKMTLTK